MERCKLMDVYLMELIVPISFLVKLCISYYFLSLLRVFYLLGNNSIYCLVTKISHIHTVYMYITQELD